MPSKSPQPNTPLILQGNNIPTNFRNTAIREVYEYSKKLHATCFQWFTVLVRMLLVAMPGAPSSDALARSSILALAPSSFI